jgi:hypothetical protein
MAIFLPFEVFNAAEFVDDVQRVCHALRGVVDIALEVDERGALFEDAIVVAFLDGVHDLECM